MPSQYSFPDNSFYVRECYAEYYDNITGQLSNRPSRSAA